MCAVASLHHLEMSTMCSEKLADRCRISVASVLLRLVKIVVHHLFAHSVIFVLLMLQCCLRSFMRLNQEADADFGFHMNYYRDQEQF